LRLIEAANIISTISDFNIEIISTPIHNMKIIDNYTTKVYYKSNPKFDSKL